ncbi:MAG: endonuclease III domain-containing protein [Elusimicrobia bacterium]|nr:endonuclease III domain-containing protein [Elusimicrobiota bacterium]
MNPRRALRRLEARFGRQGWWPVTDAGGLRPRYRPGRYAAPAPAQALEVCVGAILTQNTAWSNVEKALAAVHGARSLRRLARIPRARLERLIRPSGYFRQKAERLRLFARWAGDAPSLALRLRKSPLPALRTELLSLKGVGPETADSMLLYAGGRPAFVVDAYTRRIGSRIGWFAPAAGYAEVQAFLTARLPRSVPVYNELHALFVRLAKEHCRTKPQCAGCPLKGGCATGRDP